MESTIIMDPSGAPAPGGKWQSPVYFVLGQAAWFVTVISAAHGVAWVGELLVLVLVAAHLRRVAHPANELKLVLAVMLIGAAWESALVTLGLLAYPGAESQWLAPAWIVTMWALFVAQFNTTYRWLKPRLKLAAVFGAVAGPLSFRAGAALGAVRFVRPWPAATALACGWAVLLPTVVVLSKRWDGVRR